MASHSGSDDSIAALIKAVARFRDERDWAQFHSPKNLAAAIAIEAAELQEVLLWQSAASPKEVQERPEVLRALTEELADVIIYCFSLADSLEIDVPRAIRDKLATNAQKYPAEKARGTTKKYTDL